MNNKKKSVIAIMGPSGAGKTTLGNKLSTRFKVAIPRHCTTRSQRSDDCDGFYRYLSHEEYLKHVELGEFLITSGDGPEVKKEYGNFYGVLVQDCKDAWETSDIIILFASYKDIESLVQLKNKGLDLDIVNLTFTDIKKNVKDRLINNSTRNHTEKDIQSRVSCALNDFKKYEKALKMYSKTIVYTDILGVEETYEKICLDLGFGR